MAKSAKKTTKRAAPRKIVSAVGVSVIDRTGDVARAAAVEKAMADAVYQAMKDGVSMSNSKEIKNRMMKARDDALKGNA